MNPPIKTCSIHIPTQEQIKECTDKKDFSSLHPYFQIPFGAASLPHPDAKYQCEGCDLLMLGKTTMCYSCIRKGDDKRSREYYAKHPVEPPFLRRKL